VATNLATSNNTGKLTTARGTRKKNSKGPKACQQQVKHVSSRKKKCKKKNSFNTGGLYRKFLENEYRELLAHLDTAAELARTRVRPHTLVAVFSTKQQSWRGLEKRAGARARTRKSSRAERQSWR
jgi:hypothetical protein